MTEWVKKEEVLDIIRCLPVDIIYEYVYELKGIHIDDDKEDDSEDIMIRATIKSNVTQQDLINTFNEKGLISVYNLGLKNMLDYLNGNLILV